MKRDLEPLDVFALPVHPWAARFPMRSDEDLDAMAASIKANGLRMPIVLGMSVLEEGEPPQLCLVDGRNRREACKRAGITPVTTMLNGEDQDTYIADLNLDRRDMTKGQKAMLVADRYPKAPMGRGAVDPARGKCGDSLSFSRVQQARTVLAHCADMVDAVIAGVTGLDEALAEARVRRSVKEVKQDRFLALVDAAPDLADLVREERMSLPEAEAALRERRDQEAVEVRNAVKTIEEIGVQIGFLQGVFLEKTARIYRTNKDKFTANADLRADIAQWIALLNQLQEALDVPQSK